MRDNDELRVIALDHAVNLANNATFTPDAKHIVTQAAIFYGFLIKGEPRESATRQSATK